MLNTAPTAMAAAKQAKTDALKRRLSGGNKNSASMKNSAPVAKEQPEKAESALTEADDLVAKLKAMKGMK